MLQGRDNFACLPILLSTVHGDNDAALGPGMSSLLSGRRCAKCTSGCGLIPRPSYAVQHNWWTCSAAGDTDSAGT